MKAKQYVSNTSDLPDVVAEDEIVAGMIEEAVALAKQRRCHGGPGTNSSFGTYADCFAEQFVKWLAVCRLRPSLNKFAFARLLQRNQEPVYRMLVSKKVFKYL